MRYGITCLYLGEYPFLELSEAHYQRLVTARSNVFDALYIEEKFAFLIENYRDLEIEALANMVHNSTLPPRSWSELISDVHLFNRRIVNLLTMCRLYIDHTPHHLTTMFGSDNSVQNEFGENLSSQYDCSLAYRLLDALRNYVQHRGLPLSGLKRHIRFLTPGDPASNIEHTFQFSLDVSELVADPKFKRKVAEELKQLGSPIDLLPMIREYVGLIAKVHQALRVRIDSSFKTWVDQIVESMDQYSHGNSQLEGASSAVKEGDSGEILERYFLDRGPAKRRSELVSAYSNLDSLSRHVITTAVVT